MENPMPPIYWTFSRLWASLRVWWELVWWQWWRVEKYPSPPETTINTGVLGDKMKGEGYFAYSISENWKQRKQERYCFYLIIILLHCIVYVACCIAIKSFLNFLHRSTISSVITCSLLAGHRNHILYMRCILLIKNW